MEQVPDVSMFRKPAKRPKPAEMQTAIRDIEQATNINININNVSGVTFLAPYF